jgi:hypothetical protein
VSVGAGRTCAVLVERFEGAGQEQHGNVLGVRIALERLADLVAALAGHHHVRQHHVGSQLASLGDRIEPVVHGGELEILGGEDHPDHLADGDRVIGDEHTFGHRSASK